MRISDDNSGATGLFLKSPGPKYSISEGCKGHFTLEPMEPRLLLSGVTNYEQYMLQLINRARANPTAEVARYGSSFWNGTPDLNEGLAPGTITTAPKQPLAMNSDLLDSALGHTQDMLSSQVFSHTGSDGSDPGQRMAAAGYSFVGNWTWGENIAWSGTSGTVDQTSLTFQIEGNLFGDKGVSGRGHRLNLMSAAFREIGIGQDTGVFQGFNALMVTEDFAASDALGVGERFLTGVAFNDTVLADNFYTPGEGLGGVTITAVAGGGGGTFTTTTWSAGGYTLAVPAGTYTVTASGGGLVNPVVYQGVVVADQNVERDFQNLPAVTVTDTSGSATDRAVTLATTAVGQVSAPQTFTLTNSGNLALKISNFVKGGSNAADFAVTVKDDLGNTVNGSSFNIPTGKAYTVALTLSPATGGAKAADITFNTNDPGNAAVTLTMSGNATDLVVTTSAGSLSYSPGAGAVAVDPGIVVNDAGSSTLAGATVTISGNYASDQDVLGFTDQNGITGSWNPATGILTLSGSASVANYQAALQSVTYANTSADPSTLTRTVSFVASDGTLTSDPAVRTIKVAAGNGE